MLVSRKLLNRYVNIENIKTEELADVLTNAGLEVEGIEPLVEGNNLVVGEVISCVKHQDSDHLNLCEVNVGDEVLNIVCGASNVAKDQKVIVAKVGAVLKGGFEIKESSIRGEKSLGMICSLDELGIPEKLQKNPVDGIHVFEDAEIGQDAIEALGMKDEIMDIKQTPNRSDFMAITSIAKEVSALFKTETNLPSYDKVKIEEKNSDLKINIETDLSQQFLGKVVNKVEIKESPQWIQEALIASGMRPINNLVDISNIVMLETGQPIHFYDKEFLNPLSLSVVDDFEGEVSALDENLYTIKKGDQMIMNGETAVGIAGVMGLENSMIRDNTQSIVIEVASFDRVGVRQTAQRLGLSSEASQRFSKPMDPLAPEKAMNRAISLLIEYANAQDFEETIQAGSIDYKERTIETNINKINKLLGTDFVIDEVMDVFVRLNLQPELKDEQIHVTVPSYRNDLSIPEDLSEEVIRVLGYARLPETLPKMDLTHGTYSTEQKLQRELENIALSYGANQVVTYTLVSEDKTKGPLSIGEAIPLLSPLSESRAYLRTSLLNSMLETVRYNKARKVNNNFIFEESRLYAKDNRETHLAIMAEGYLNEETWLKDSIKLDFFYLKGMFLEMMSRIGIQEQRFSFTSLEDESQTFNPYKGANILFDRKKIGVLAHLHPKFSAKNDLDETVYLEVNIDPILNAKRGSIKSQKLSKHHDIVRDMAVLVDNSLTSEELMRTMMKASKRSIKDLSVFDVFESVELGNKKSLAFKLKFDGEKITSSKDIQLIMENIENELVSKHQAIIR